VPFCEQRHRDDDAEKAAVKTHAAFPQLEDVERVGQVFQRLVEQHVAQPPAEDDAEHAVEQHVVEHVHGPAGPRPMRDAPAPEHDDLQKGDEVHEAVPVDGDGAELQGDGVELRMNEHEVSGWGRGR